MYTKVYDATIASFATSSGEVNLGGQGWYRVFIEVPAMTSNTTAHIQASPTSGGTYRRVVQKDPGSAVASVDWAIQSTTTNRLVECAVAHGLPFLKVETANIISFTAAYKIWVAELP